MCARIFAIVCIFCFGSELAAQFPPLEFRIGRAGHAFDHLGGIGGQADTAAESGATIIYTGGLGEAGYHGLPPQNEFKLLCDHVSQYNRRAKAAGIELAIGYLCATSIVKLDTFDKNWTDEFRRQFKTRPADWQQQDRQGKPLPSWYGGDYAAACMSNPDWRAYERAMVRYTLETGHDGVFFDNPTVHPKGCYCHHCMAAFAKFIESSPLAPREEVFSRSEKSTIEHDEALRKVADEHPKEFLRFRCEIASSFLEDLSNYAGTINPRALVTCNNSLNAPSALYSQCRTYGYNIRNMSRAEDYVVVEDMNTQPRTEAGGQTFEYGPTYKQLHAISRRKPIVAVTVANSDYHTPPNLMRLAMAEAAANNASYMSWPTWPEEQRKRMIAAVRPQADFLRRNEALLNDSRTFAPFRADVVLYLPFERWTETDDCAASKLAATLTKSNIQYEVVSEDGIDSLQYDTQPTLLVESPSDFTKNDERNWLAKFKRNGGKIVEANKPDWLNSLQKTIGQRSLDVEGPATVRGVVHDLGPRRTVVHLYNLNVERLSSFDDKVTPAANVNVTISVPFDAVRTVKIDSADQAATRGNLKFSTRQADGKTLVSFTVPQLVISSICVIER